MDWNKITNTLNPYLTKAKEFGKKAAEFTENQIQTTPIFIKTQAEYDALINEKRVILISYDETHAVANDIRLFSTMWITRAFVDNAKIKFISLTQSRDLVSNLWLVDSIDMRVFFEWNQIHQITEINKIKDWWKNPIYKMEESSVQSESTETAPIDPLSGK